MSNPTLKPSEALTLLENIRKEAPEKRQAALNTITESAIAWAAQAQNRDGFLLANIERINKALKLPPLQMKTAVAGTSRPAARPAAPAPAPAAEDAPAAPQGVSLAEDGTLVGAEGLSDEERKAALEALMNESIAAGEAEKAAAAQTQAPAGAP